jgi:serine/threonine protein kinase
VHLTTAIDMYAFGLIAAEMLLDQPLDILQSLARESATMRDSLVAAGTPTALADLVMYCLDGNPALRPTAADVLSFIEQGTPFVPPGVGASDTPLTSDCPARLPVPSERDSAAPTISLAAQSKAGGDTSVGALRIGVWIRKCR